jgi:hypothetical protein
MPTSELITLRFADGPWDSQELVSLKPPVRVVTVDDGAYHLDRYTASARPGDPPEAFSYSWNHRV